MPRQHLRPGRTIPANALPGLLALLVGWLPADDTHTVALRTRLEAAVTQHIMTGFSKSGLSGEIVSIQLPRNLDQLDASSSIVAVKAFLPRQAGGRYVIPIRLTPPGGPSIRINALVQCVAVLTGWVARMPLDRETALSSGEFERKVVRITRRERDYFTADALPEGHRLSARIEAGQFLRYHHLEPIPAVKRGERVTVRFKRSTLTLVSPGKARRDGRIGDMIPVVVTVTGKRFHGRLVSPGIVVVE